MQRGGKYKNISGKNGLPAATVNRSPTKERPEASYYVVKRHRLGNALLDLVRRSLIENTITPTKAGHVLGVKPRNVEPLVNGPPAQVQG